MTLALPTWVNRSLALLTTGAGLFLFTACSTSTVAPRPELVGYDYYPLETGRYVTYQVNDVNYRVIGDSVVNNYQMKWQVGTPFQNGSGGTTYQLNSYKRASETEPWVLDSIYTTERTRSAAILNRGNVERVKLVFPLTTGATWNEDMLNVRAGDNQYRSKVQRVGVPATIGALNLPATAWVVARADSSLRGRNFENETYAAGVGLVAKYYENVEFDEQNQNRIAFGRRYRQTAIQYGKE